MSSAPTRDIRTAEFRAHLDKFKVFRVEEGSHWRGPSDSDFVLATSAWLPSQYVKTKQDYTNDTPYILEKHSAGLFPEWYFHLMRNFARRSAFHSFYCSKTADEFLNFLTGPELERKQITSAMNEQFSLALRAGLGPQLDRYFEGIPVLSRSAAEAVVVRELAKFSSWPSVLSRTNELVKRTFTGDVLPYAFFLMAYDCSENYIWMTMATLLMKKCYTHVHVTCLSEKIDSLRHLPTSLGSRLRQLVAYLFEQGILHDRKPLYSEVAANSRPPPITVTNADFTTNVTTNVTTANAPTSTAPANAIDTAINTAKPTQKEKVSAINGEITSDLPGRKAGAKSSVIPPKVSKKKSKSNELAIQKLLAKPPHKRTKQENDLYSQMRNPSSRLYRPEASPAHAPPSRASAPIAKGKPIGPGKAMKTESAPINFRRTIGREREQDSP